jgi:mannose-6-phosphate isomerase-like protein (cupin superfamily)
MLRHFKTVKNQMGKIARIDVSRDVIDIRRDLSISTRVRKPGPPQRMDGMTMGVVGLDPDAPAPHAGEVHPDGDEILYLISGRVRVIGESAPSEDVELGAGEACIVPKGEWHRIHVIEGGQLIHITPGPSGGYRPV